MFITSCHWWYVPVFLIPVGECYNIETSVIMSLMVCSSFPATRGRMLLYRNQCYRVTGCMFQFSCYPWENVIIQKLVLSCHWWYVPVFLLPMGECYYIETSVRVWPRYSSYPVTSELVQEGFPGFRQEQVCRIFHRIFRGMCRFCRNFSTEQPKVCAGCGILYNISTLKCPLLWLVDY